jgi:transcriptional regulator with XRE-family HTH domain
MPTNVAGIVKALRRQAGFTLNQLSAAADVAASTISKIESGQLSPGYEIIIRLARGLKVDVAELFRSDTTSMPTGRRSLTRKGEGTIYDSANYEYEVLAGELSNKLFVPLKAIVKAGELTKFGPLTAHEGEEFVLVLEGEVILHSEHYEPSRLSPGDSVYFDSRAGHALISANSEDAMVLWICSNRETLALLRDTV